jgi:hypothetical protein
VEIAPEPIEVQEETAAEVTQTIEETPVVEEKTEAKPKAKKAAAPKEKKVTAPKEKKVAAPKKEKAEKKAEETVEVVEEVKETE